MAQGAVAVAPANGAALTAEELREFLEYERIIQFRDAVMAGKHPRIKIPAHLIAKPMTLQSTSSLSISTPSHPDANPRMNPSMADSNSAPSPNTKDSSNKSAIAPRSPGPLRLPRSSQAEINPILLEKSDDLIKAEIQLQRQRLERALREQIEQQRLATKALLQTSESLPDFDLTEVLSKALAIVHPSTTAEAEPPVGGRSSGSDSFDENTFYSSQHDTPELSTSPQNPKKIDSVQSAAVQPVHQNLNLTLPSKPQMLDQDLAIAGSSPDQNNLQAAQRHVQYSPTHGRETLKVTGRSGSSVFREDEAPLSMDKRRRSHCTSANANNPVSQTSKNRLTNLSAVQVAIENLEPAFERESASTLVRNHNLSPVAPKPARVSPLVTTRDHPYILQEATIADEAQPPQVAALRSVPGVSSSDSSPKGTKNNERKKEKKKGKKRKAKDSADTPESPFIKPEPRSPSPFAVAPLEQPQKRHRPEDQYVAELNYESRPERQRMRGRISATYDEPERPLAYQQGGARYIAAESLPHYRRVEVGDGEYRRISTGKYIRHPHSPVYNTTHHPSESRTRAASTTIERRVPEDGRYFRESLVRASVRPDADRERSRSPVLRENIVMGPPRQPARIVIDEYGRKYYDPARLRPAVGHPTRYRDEEIISERAPVRTRSVRPLDIYDEEDSLIRRGSPAVTLPRRVVTQPEYLPAMPDYRSYRQREYSARPIAMGHPGEDYVSIKAAQERAHGGSFEDELPREYIRASTVRPEVVRYETPRDYVGRMQSVRPDAPFREFAASVRPEVGRKEALAQTQREYSVRPSEPTRREQFSVPQVGQYYEEVPRVVLPRQERVVVHRGSYSYDDHPSRIHAAPVPPGEHLRGAEVGQYEDAYRGRSAEVAFIERPHARESSVLVYADDVRQKVYR